MSMVVSEILEPTILSIGFVSIHCTDRVDFYYGRGLSVLQSFSSPYPKLEKED